MIYNFFNYMKIYRNAKRIYEKKIILREGQTKQLEKGTLAPTIAVGI